MKWFVAVKARLLFPYRLKLAFSYLQAPLVQAVRWAWRAKEHTNLTYDLTAINRLYLAQFIAEIESISAKEVLKYFEELENDKDLKKAIARRVRDHSRGWLAESSPKYGRRLAWYAWIRIRKPKIVVETGVDKGLGSCVLMRALERNTIDGRAGYYYGTDIHPEAGWMIPEALKPYGKILYGDSLKSLAELDEAIDLFINDSDHSIEYEAKEYLLVQKRLSKNGLILGDNAHCSRSLIEFSNENGRHFYYFSEKPKAHWYPGGGIGVSVK